MLAVTHAAKGIAGWDAAVSAFGRRDTQGWQLAMAQPLHALRAALYVQAALRRLDKRLGSCIALAVSKGVLPDGPTPRLDRGHGPAFTRSAALLATLGPQRRMAHARGGAQHAAFVLADHVARGWTQAQARAVAEHLPPGAGPTSETATRLGISRQAVDQALSAAGFPALDAALTAWEAI